MARGLLITFEGSEGCGKSTQIARLVGRLKSRGMPCEVTREPGGTRLGEAIRHLLKFAPEGQGMTPEAELLLFAASRAQLVREKLEPLLESGVTVIADRFLDSTVVYQGLARGLDAQEVRRINDFAVGSCRPDLTFVLDVETELARRRVLQDANREAQHDRMESEALPFYERVRQGYLELASREPERMIVLDGSREADGVEDAIWQTLNERTDGLFTRKSGSTSG